MNIKARLSNLSILAPPVYNKENYHAWVVKMQVYMEGCDYWEAVEDDYEVAALPDNLTLNQIRHHKEMKTIKSKAKTCLYAVVSPTFLEEPWLVTRLRKYGISSKQSTKEMKISRV